MRGFFYTLSVAAALTFYAGAANAYCPYPLTEIQCRAAEQAAINDYQQKQENDFRNLQNEASQSLYQYHYNRLNGIPQQGYYNGWQPNYNRSYYNDNFNNGVGFGFGVEIGKQVYESLSGGNQPDNGDALLGKVPPRVPGRNYVDLPECTAKMIRKSIPCYQPIN